MIKKWDVAPAPDEKHPGRHKLLINGEMKDIFLIVKKLGSICSRPEKASGDFNFVIYLSELEIGTMTKLKAITAELSPKGGAASESSHHGPAPFNEPKLALKTEPAPEAPAPGPRPAPAPEPYAAPAPVFKPEPAPAPEPYAAPAPVFKPEPAPAPEPYTAPVPVFKPEPAPPAGPPAAQPGISNRGPAMNFVPSETSRAKAPEQAPAPVPAKIAVPQPVPASVSARKKTRWSMELPLIPTYSFQTLVAGSHNRFAHAAAMAVVENPGVIYNPLLIHGGPGTGKTHFLNSISYGLSASIGQGNIFVTDGIRFSKGVEMAAKDGTMSKLEEILGKVKVLIIDDAHLLMISAVNQKYISKLLNDFVAQNKQIVVTTVFPPKSLSGLEDAVGFQFTQGWMVDLKLAGAQAYKTILTQLMQGMEVKLSDEEITAFFAAKQVPFGEAIKNFEGMKKLEKFVVNSMNTYSHAQLLEMMLGVNEAPEATEVSEEDCNQMAAWRPSTADAWFKWGLFYPKGQKREADFTLFSLHQRAKELGLNTEWNQVFTEEYNSDELYGIPFKIGDYALERGVNGVIILGPQPASALGAQEGEFRHITLKITDSFGIKGAWLPFDKIKSKAAYARILMGLV